jgi:hypothetical protein
MPTLDTVREILLALPGTTETTSYNAPAFNVKGKYLGRLMDDGQSMSVHMERDERPMWCKLDPKSFTVPPDFENYNYICVHLASVRLDDLRAVLENAWRSRAPKSLKKSETG